MLDFACCKVVTADYDGRSFKRSNKVPGLCTFVCRSGVMEKNVAVRESRLERGDWSTHIRNSLTQFVVARNAPVIPTQYL